MANNNNVNRNAQKGSGKVSSGKGQRGSRASQHNDAAWYGSNAFLVNDSASLAWSTPIGSTTTALDENVNYNYAIGQPGIMTLDVIPVLGYSEDNTSAVNIAARNVYSFVRHVNSGHSNYDAPDLMLYMMALDSAYSFLCWMTRTYGYLMLYSMYNRYLPDALLTANHIDAADLRNHITDLRAFVNMYTVKLGSLVLPASMPVTARHCWMYSGFYADSPNLKAQLYQYAPKGFYQYDELNGAGRLVFKPLVPETTEGKNKLLKFADITTYATALLNSIVTSEDCAIMSGDILKAFGPEGVIKLPYLEESYVILPTYSVEVLCQIQNATVLGGNFLADDFMITQSVTTDPRTSGAIIQKPRFQPGIGSTPHTKPLLDNYHAKRYMYQPGEQDDPSQNMVSSRLMVFGEVDPSEAKPYINLTTVGTEIVTSARITAIDPNGIVTINPGLAMIDYADTAQGFLAQTIQACLVSKFSFHPCTAFYSAFYFKDDTQKEAITLLGLMDDVSNYTTVTEDVIKRMHDTALLSLYNVPIMGAFATKTTSSGSAKSAPKRDSSGGKSSSKGGSQKEKGEEERLGRK